MATDNDNNDFESEFQSAIASIDKKGCKIKCTGSEVTVKCGRKSKAITFDGNEKEDKIRPEIKRIIKEIIKEIIEEIIGKIMQGIKIGISSAITVTYEGEPEENITFDRNATKDGICSAIIEKIIKRIKRIVSLTVTVEYGEESEARTFYGNITEGEILSWINETIEKMIKKIIERINKQKNQKGPEIGM